MLLFTMSPTLHAQDEAKTIFTRAVDQLLTDQMIFPYILQPLKAMQVYGKNV